MSSNSNRLSLIEDNTDISRETLEEIPEILVNLKSLSLQGLDQVDDNFLTMLSAGCPKLNFLNLSYCSNISDDGVAEVITHCDDLKILIVEGTTISDDFRKVINQDFTYE